MVCAGAKLFAHANLEQELAWASYALLKNTNCCGVVLYSRGQVLMARGALGAAVVAAGNTSQTLSSMSQVCSLLYSTVHTECH
jgi:hypothetical protein